MKRMVISLYKESISNGMRLFGETKTKAVSAYTQSGQYHTMVENRGS